MPKLGTTPNTWNGEPWNEDTYTDLRIAIEDKSTTMLQALNLDISVAETSQPFRIAAIDQLTDTANIEFPKPDMDIVAPLPGADGQLHNFPFSFSNAKRWGSIPVKHIAVYIPHVFYHQKVRLILAAVHDIRGDTSLPDKIRITGRYETVVDDAPYHGEIDKLILLGMGKENSCEE